MPVCINVQFVFYHMQLSRVWGSPWVNMHKEFDICTERHGSSPYVNLAAVIYQLAVVVISCCRPLADSASCILYSYEGR